KFLAKSSFDEETKSDEGTNDSSLAPQDDDGSGDEWSEYVDRGWKKHRHYDATEDEDSKDDTPVDELRISEEFKHLFKDPVKDFLAFMPLAFWNTVTVRTNAKAVALQAAHPKGYVGGREFKKSIDLVEVMKFVGLLIVMSVVQGGEYSLYWSKPSSHRVINMDNWYSSVQLCLTLLKMGMYCRGTVRSNRAHNPRFGMFDKKQIKSVMRGFRDLSTMEYANLPMTQSAKVLKKAAADKAAAEDKAAALKRDASLRQPPTPSITSRATDKQAEVSYDQGMRRYCVVCYFERNK
ncbi:hypothetical protein DYB30_007281, partial [Aphanomyces astaci]